MLTFFVISFLTNIIGPLIPDMIKGFHLNLTLVSFLPFSFFIAYGVMSIPSGMLIEKFREKRIMISAFFVSFFGSLILAFSPNYITAILSLFLIGCGMAMLQVVINPLLRTAGGEENYAFNSVLAQLVFGFASFISPRVYSFIVLNLKMRINLRFQLFSILKSNIPPNLPWISLYWLFSILSLAMIFIIGFSKFPKVELKQEEVVGPWRTYIFLLKKKVVILFFVAMFCYVGTEQGVADWISRFLQTYHGLNPQTFGADAVSYFWGFMTAGGVLGLLLLKIFDSRFILILFTILAIFFFSIAIFSIGTISLFGNNFEISFLTFPLVGFFASVMYPIIFALALNSVSEHHGSFSGIMVTGIIGGAVIPFIIGWLGDHFGLRVGMMFLYLTMGYILSIGFWAHPLINNKTIRLVKGKLPISR